MDKHESNVKHIPFPVDRVYSRLSDLNNLETLRQSVADPSMREALLQQAGDTVSPEQMEQYAEQLQNMRLTADTLTMEVPMMGEVTLRIVERQEPKLVKFESEGAPLQANLWLQLLPEGEAGCAMKVTLGVDLNFFLKQMVGGKLQDAVERLADMLARIPY